MAKLFNSCVSLGLLVCDFSTVLVVEPRDSAWFSFYNGIELVPLQDQPIYKEDWIGLKNLDERGGLIFDECPTQHMHFTWDWFKEAVVEKHLLKKRQEKFSSARVHQ